MGIASKDFNVYVLYHYLIYIYILVVMLHPCHKGNRMLFVDTLYTVVVFPDCIFASGCEFTGGYFLFNLHLEPAGHPLK